MDTFFSFAHLSMGNICRTGPENIASLASPKILTRLTGDTHPLATQRAEYSTGLAKYSLHAPLKAAVERAKPFPEPVATIPIGIY